MDKGKKPARSELDTTTEDPRLAKRKRKKKEVPPVNVAEDLRAAREHWTRNEAKDADPKDPMLRQMSGEGDQRDLLSKAVPMSLVDPPMQNPMQEGTQRMVASARDLMDIKTLQEMRPEVYGTLTPNQVWSLVAAERKGELQHGRAMHDSELRLVELNKKFGTDYEPDDLPAIFRSLRDRRLASNFFLSLPPGGNRDGVAEGPSLLDHFIADADGLFRNVWETGTSQASSNLATRGGVEERFGYAFALKRTEGVPLTFFGGGDGKFATAPVGAPVDDADTSPAGMYLRKLQAESPNYLKPGEMPKYAAAVGESQVFGVSARYGSSVVYWKPDIDWRTTRTPGDSWSSEYLQSALSFVSANYPESVFAYTDISVARLAAAEATGFKRDRELAEKIEETGGNLSAYIETQIHGDLSWKDVDKVVLNYGTYGGIKGNMVITYEDVEKDAEKLRRFAKANGYGFTVEMGRKYVHSDENAEK
ncbi:hypothetical protein CKY47_31440 [Saccharothrix yanglingensis]|uniref:Uncharacterized protein n=1 Tax=Saccharothrix yanglingensis TaxID=659496 RepID=A0ABU0X8D3_9PSEU|nr:hypothetical protein [Saccharothrix yanglingensis]